MKLAIALTTVLLVVGLLAVSLVAVIAKFVWIAFRGRRPDLYARFAFSGGVGVVAAIGLLGAALAAQYDLDAILFRDVLHNGVLAVGVGGLLGILARAVTLRSEAE